MGIYLDYAATAPLKPEIRQLFERLSLEPLGNASSLHRFGRRARMLLEGARESVAQSLDCRVEEVVFTSGATESDNLALWGVSRLASAGSHLLVSAVEHPAIMAYAEALTQSGFAVEKIPVDRQGRVHPDEVAARLRPETCLVSVMAVNNEVGTIQPLEQLAEVIKGSGALFHVDAAQSPLRPSACGADLISYSSHKLGGLPGGLLYVRKGVALAPIFLGGAQEDSRRAGTSAVLQASCTAEALKLYFQEDRGEILKLRQYWERLLGSHPQAELLAGQAERAPHVSAWLFGERPAEPLLVRLDLRGVAASSGSACSSHSIEPSKVLLAMGYGEQRAAGLIRFSLGWRTTRAELDQAWSVLQQELGVAA